MSTKEDRADGKLLRAEKIEACFTKRLSKEQATRKLILSSLTPRKAKSIKVQINKVYSSKFPIVYNLLEMETKKKKCNFNLVNNKKQMVQRKRKLTAVEEVIKTDSEVSEEKMRKLDLQFPRKFKTRNQNERKVYLMQHLTRSNHKAKYMSQS